MYRGHICGRVLAPAEVFGHLLATVPGFLDDEVGGVLHGYGDFEASDELLLGNWFGLFRI